MKKFYLLFFLPLFALAQVPSYVPTNSLLAWYPFTGNANDLSGNSHNGTVIGATATTDRFGNASSAYNFGTNMYITVPDNATNFRPQNISVSLWVSFSVAPSAQYYVPFSKNSGSGSNGSESMLVFWYNLSNSWCANTGSISMQNPYIATPTQTIVPNNWIHLVYTFDDVNNTQFIYVNGIFSSSATINGSIEYDTDVWTIGNQYDLGSMQWWFPGKIDDIGVWSRALNASEALALYCAGNPSFQTQPMSQSVTPVPSVSFVAVSSSTSALYQWQADVGAGFNNISNGGQYSGVTTPTLTVSNVTLSNHLNVFRCIASTTPCAGTSNNATLSVTATIGMEESTSFKGAELFPNPTSDILTLRVSAATILGDKFALLDVTGKKVIQGEVKEKNNRIDVSGLTPGIYFFEMNDQRKKIMIK